MNNLIFITVPLAFIALTLIAAYLDVKGYMRERRNVKMFLIGVGIGLALIGLHFTNLPGMVD